jgi:hypothetical protein
MASSDDQKPRLGDGDLHDWNSDEMKALGPEARGKLIMDSVAPRSYSWMTNQDGLKYLHEHEIGGAPPGSFAVSAPDTMASRTTASRTPLWYMEGSDDD